MGELWEGLLEWLEWILFATLQRDKVQRSKVVRQKTMSLEQEQKQRRKIIWNLPFNDLLSFILYLFAFPRFTSPSPSFLVETILLSWYELFRAPSTICPVRTYSPNGGQDSTGSTVCSSSSHRHYLCRALSLSDMLLTSPGLCMMAFLPLELCMMLAFLWLPVHPYSCTN